MFAEHTGALYDTRVRFEKLIKRQIETGHYSIEEGQRLWRGWFDHAAALYEKEFGGDSRIRFPEDVRDQAAKEWEVDERQYIAEGSTAAGPLWGGAKPNPIARKGYKRRAALNSDLERYYKGCMTGHAAKHFRAKARRESYCSAVSWKIARNAHRYPDYFRNPVEQQLSKNELSELRKVANNEGYVDRDQFEIRQRLIRMGYLNPSMRLTAKGRAAFVVIKETPMPMLTMIKNPLSAPTKVGVAVLGGLLVFAGIVFAMSKTASASTGSTGTVTFTTDASGNSVIMLAPGNMGSVNVVSAASATSVAQTTVFNLEAPVGGVILSVVSSNTNVLEGATGSSQTLSLGSANKPGTTVISVSWSLNGTQQNSSFVVIAS
jgi:hypothetical protein